MAAAYDGGGTKGCGECGGEGGIVVAVTCDRGDEYNVDGIFLAPLADDAKPLLPLPDTADSIVLPLYSALAGTSADAVWSGVGITRTEEGGERVSGFRCGEVGSRFVAARGSGSRAFDCIRRLRRYQKYAPTTAESATHAATVAPAITPVFDP